MRSSSSLALIVAALGAAAGCSDPVGGGNNPPVDSGANTDRGTANTDTGTTNTDSGTPMDSGTPTDGGTPTDNGTQPGDRPAADTGVDAGPPYDPCAAAAVIDLNAMGMTTGNETRITRNNNSVGAMAPLRSSCGRPGHEVAFRYTPRTAARLRISTNNAGTDMAFDTVVWAQAACAPPTGDAGVMDLGCSDDNGTAPRGRTSAFTTAAAAAMGTPIYIIVAGYTPPTGSEFRAQGTFELSVTEIATVAVGGACDVAGATSACAMGSLCVGATAMATMGTCVADGAQNGRCRAMGTACDGTLVCSGSATSTSSRCRTSVAAGAACDPDRVMNICATGTNCVTRAGMSTCVSAGAAGGACRATEPRCDGMLSCSSAGVCRTVVAADGACESNNGSTVCASGGTCVPTTPGAAMGTCRAAGSAAGTACREAAPRCDTGLTCTTMTGTGTCRRNVAAGAACTPGLAADLCAMGTACLPTSATAGTCSMTATAETEPNNTPAMAQAPITTWRMYSGTAMGTDVDCFGVTVPMGAGIFAESNLPATPTCPSGETADPVVEVFNPAGTEIDSVDDTTGRGYCGTLSPANSSDVRNLAAGNYTVCIRNIGEAPANYLLTIGIIPPG